jgi:hypothetical protein
MPMRLQPSAEPDETRQQPWHLVMHSAPLGSTRPSLPSAEEAPDPSASPPTPLPQEPSAPSQEDAETVQPPQ